MSKFSRSSKRISFITLLSLVSVLTSCTLEFDFGSLSLGLSDSSDSSLSTTDSSSLLPSSSLNVSLPELSDYYLSAEGKAGEELKLALHNIVDDHVEYSYADVWIALQETDEDPNNPNNVILLYSGISRDKDTHGGNVGDWNREHVWAKSHGDFGTTMGAGTDLHHLRPADLTVNSTRNNLDFDEVSEIVGRKEVTSAPGNYYTSNAFEPRDEVKGDVARMLMYMAVRYIGDKTDEPKLILNEKLDNGTTSPTGYMGKLSTLLQWNLADLPDEFEQNRNNIIEEWQGNRNPFIDYPEFATLIWGS